MQHIIALHPELKALLDRMVTHLCQQRSRCVSYDNTCSYRGVDGAMCAVGALIPDDLYDADIEGSVLEIFERGHYRHQEHCQAVAKHLQELAPEVNESDLIDFLEMVQAYHDTTASDTYMPRREFRLAKEVNFTLALNANPPSLRERMLADIDRLIESYLSFYPANAIEWLA